MLTGHRYDSQLSLPARKTSWRAGIGVPLLVWPCIGRLLRVLDTPLVCAKSCRPAARSKEVFGRCGACPAATSLLALQDNLRDAPPPRAGAAGQRRGRGRVGARARRQQQPADRAAREPGRPDRAHAARGAAQRAARAAAAADRARQPQGAPLRNPRPPRSPASGRALRAQPSGSPTSWCLRKRLCAWRRMPLPGPIGVATVAAGLYA